MVKLELTNSKKIAYSSGNLSVNLMSQAFATYIVFYYVDVLGVRPALISLAMIIHGIFNAVLNPLFGYMSDRTTTRWGRRIPYISFGMLPLAAVFTLVWLAPVHASMLFWYFLVVVLVYDILFVIVVLNWTSLFPEMFETLKERSYISAWRQMLGIIGMIVGVAVSPLLYSSLGWPMLGAIFGIIVLAFFAISLYGSKENLHVHTASFSFFQALRYTFSNKAFVTYVLGSFFVQFSFALLPAAIPFFAKYVLQIPEAQNSVLLGTIFIVAIPMVYVWSRIVDKWGTRSVILLAVFLLMLSLLAFIFIHHFTAAVIGSAAIGFALAGILILLDVFLAEIIDEDEKKSGARREGMYFGMNGFIVRWGVSLQAAVMGMILEWSGYRPHAAVQSAGALAGIRSMMSLIPAAALMISLVFFYLYPIRGKKR